MGELILLDVVFLAFEEVAGEIAVEEAVAQALQAAVEEALEQEEAVEALEMRTDAAEDVSGRVVKNLRLRLSDDPDAVDKWKLRYEQRTKLTVTEDPPEVQPGSRDSGPVDGGQKELPDDAEAENRINDNDNPVQKQAKAEDVAQTEEKEKGPIRKNLKYIIGIPLAIAVVLLHAFLIQPLCALGKMVTGKSSTCSSCRSSGWRCAYDCCGAGCNQIKSARKWITKYQGWVYLGIAVVAIAIGFLDNSIEEMAMIWGIGWAVIWVFCSAFGYLIAELGCTVEGAVNVVKAWS